MWCATAPLLHAHRCALLASRLRSCGLCACRLFLKRRHTATQDWCALLAAQAHTARTTPNDRSVQVSEVVVPLLSMQQSVLL